MLLYCQSYNLCKICNKFYTFFNTNLLTYVWTYCKYEYFLLIFLQAIRDGVIEASIDHDQCYVQSKETSDIYSTREPMTAFHQRIKFCLDIHNSSVKVSEFCKENGCHLNVSFANGILLSNISEMTLSSRLKRLYAK